MPTAEALADPPAISLRRLSKTYGRIRAVQDLSLDVRPGEVFGFLGLNGAGKTTTIRVLLDLLRPSSGNAAIFGVDCQKESRAARRLVGYLPAELGLFPDMTGLELLDLAARLSGGADPGARRALLDRLELADSDVRRRIREYSSGMKRKLGIVQALQADPPLLILDEPTEGLDPLVQAQLNEILFEVRRRGRTVFLSSHVLSEVERVCDRIAVLRAGEVVLLATVAEARRLGGRTVRVRFSRAVDAIPLPEGVTRLEGTPDAWVLRAPGEIGGLVAALAALPVRDLEVAEPALEDVLRSFYREGER